MNVNKMVNIINSIVYFVVLVLCYRTLGNSGMGIFICSFVLYYLIFTILVGSIRNTIAKMVSSRVKRGFNENANKVFRYTIIYSVLISLVVCGLMALIGNWICNLIFKDNLSASVMVVFGVLMIIHSLSDVLRGYYLGFGGNSPILYIGEIFKDIILVVSSIFIVNHFKGYGIKIAALKNDQIMVGIYGAIGVVIALCISFFVFMLILIAGINSLNRQDNFSFNEVRSKDGFFTFLRSYIPAAVKKLREIIFPILPVFVIAMLLVRSNMVTAASKDQVYSNASVVLTLIILIVAIPIMIIRNYTEVQYIKLRIDFKKEDRKTLLIQFMNFMKSVFTIAVPLFVSFAAFSGVITSKLLLCDNGSATAVAIICAFAFLLAALDLVFCESLSAVNLEMAVFIGNIAAFAVSLIFGIACSKSGMKMTAAAMAILLFYLIAIIIHAVFAVQNIGFRINDFLSKLIKIAIAMLPMLVLDIILAKFVSMNIVTGLICGLIGYIVYMVVFVLLQGVNQKDINNLQGSVIYYAFSLLGNVFHVR